MEFLINFLPFHSIANKWLIDMKLSLSDKAVSSTLFILVLPINTQIIFNFHFIPYWFSVSFNFNFRLFSRMWYLHSVNKARTLLKFIVYPKAFEAVGKIFVDVSCFVNWWLPKFWAIPTIKQSFKINPLGLSLKRLQLYLVRCSKTLQRGVTYLWMLIWQKSSKQLSRVVRNTMNVTQG